MVRLLYLLVGLGLFAAVPFVAPDAGTDDEGRPSAAPAVDDWAAVEAAARGQEVDWYAWGGETHINDYIAWVGEQVARRYDVTLRQVKVADTGEAVARVLAEIVAGRTRDGAVDLIWINGENFAAMKEKGLLADEAWAEALPNRRWVDQVRHGEAIARDFGVPVEGRESPWGRSQLVFIHDPQRTPRPPRSLDALLAYAETHPGRFTYPQPPAFLGTTFLKQILLASVPDPQRLQQPAGEDAPALVRDHLLPILARLHPHLWRSARAFPKSGADLRRLFADGEIDLALTMNPSDAAAGVRAGLLPPSSTVATFDAGTIGNMHFVTIPTNAGDREGALVVANFLLSPEAQARKADPKVWGDPTVLALDALPEGERAMFTREVAVEAPALAEPHASWTPVVERVWNEAFLQ